MCTDWEIGAMLLRCKRAFVFYHLYVVVMVVAYWRQG